VSKKNPKHLVVTFDVTGLSKEQVDALSGDAVVQGEASDGAGGKRYHKGETAGHPDVRVLEISKITKRGKKQSLVITFDVTGLTKSEVGALASEVEVQAEGNDDSDVAYPGVPVASEVITPTPARKSK